MTIKEPDLLIRPNMDLIEQHHFPNQNQYTLGKESIKTFKSAYTLGNLENVKYGKYVYFAPNSNGILVRLNLETEEFQYFNLKKFIKNKDATCIGIDVDENGHIYMVTRVEGTLIKVTVNNQRFDQSQLESLALPQVSEMANKDFGRLYVNVLYDKGYIYISPIGHGDFIRVSTDTFSISSAEIVDVAQLDPEATGYHGIAVDNKGFLWAAPNHNGTKRIGKAVRIDTKNFSLSGTTIFDFEKINPNALGYNGVCYNSGKLVFAPHYNEKIGHNGLIAIVDANNPRLNTIKFIDAHKVNKNVGGMMSCVNVKNKVFILPYSKKHQKYHLEFPFIERIGSFPYLRLRKIIRPKSLPTGLIAVVDVKDEKVKIVDYFGSLHDDDKILSQHAVFDGKENIILSPAVPSKNFIQLNISQLL